MSLNGACFREVSLNRRSLFPGAPFPEPEVAVNMNTADMDSPGLSQQEGMAPTAFLRR